jgi:hypothetical protein
VMYQNGQLYQINPALKNSPATAGSVLAVPPPPVDPFGLGNFFNGRSLPPAREGGQSYNPLAAPPPTAPVFNFDGAQFNLGELVTVEDAMGMARAMAAALFQARTGVAA